MCVCVPVCVVVCAIQLRALVYIRVGVILKALFHLHATAQSVSEQAEAVASVRSERCDCRLE